MLHRDPLDAEALARQIEFQRRHAWNVERDLPWSLGIDAAKCLLPLDEEAIAFPGASPEQRRIISHWMGLVVNTTIAEMENVIHKLREIAWDRILRSYPVNPEMRELGELFFEEETKHARAFTRYVDLYCKSQGMDREALGRLMPQAFGSLFQRATIANARAGGHAFWWVVASVEEVSLEIYRQIHPTRSTLDPLFYQIHRRHAEDEARHRNYAFLMLELIDRRRGSVSRLLHKRLDLIFAQLFSIGWVVAELGRVFSARDLASQHPFFAELAGCLPLLERVRLPELFRRVVVSAPYISLMINTHYHRFTMQTAREQNAWSLPLPRPRLVR
jgi:hypothetical protein